jgi:hypothetical protein
MNYIIKQIAHVKNIPAKVILDDKSKTVPKRLTYIDPHILVLPPMLLLETERKLTLQTCMKLA